jgi:hypothetical protein
MFAKFETEDTEIITLIQLYITAYSLSVKAPLTHSMVWKIRFKGISLIYKTITVMMLLHIILTKT